MRRNPQNSAFDQEEEKFPRGGGRLCMQIQEQKDYLTLVNNTNNKRFGKLRTIRGGPPLKKRYQKKPVGCKKSTQTGFEQTDKWFDGKNYIAPPISLDEKFYKKLVPGIAQADSKQKDYYFQSYSHYHIHQQMIGDRVRTQSYQKAIESNPQYFRDKIVLDIGCGTGILSIFAMRAGAKHVYGIDMADVALYAKQIMIDNNFQDKITIIKGKVQDIDLQKDYGVDKVDIIISQWMGYMLLYQSMLDTVLYARDRWLRDGGILLPQKVSLHVVGIQDEQYKRNKYSFWENVYGVNMSCMQRGALSQVLVDRIQKDQICTSSFKFWEADLRQVQVADLDFSNEYHIKMMRNDDLYALAVWFDVEFTGMKNYVRFSTGPYSQGTHWQQAVLYLDQPFYRLQNQDQIDGSIALKKGKKNFREIDVKFSVNHFYKHQSYNQDDANNQQQIGQHQIVQLKLR